MNILVGLINALKENLFKLISSFLPAIITDRAGKRRSAAAEKEQIHEKRPELKITGYKNYLARKNNYGIRVNSDLEVLMAFFKKVEVEGESLKNATTKPVYEVRYGETKDWRCVIYRLANVGKTAISSINVISPLKKELCLFEVGQIDKYGKAPAILSYSVLCDRKLYPGDFMILKLIYNKDEIRYVPYSASIYIGLIDDNNRRWIQPLFAPVEKIYDSKLISYECYKKLKSAEYIDEMVKKRLVKRRKRISLKI